MAPAGRYHRGMAARRARVHVHAALMAALSAGCLPAPAEPCGDGTLCPVGRTCAIAPDDTAACVPADQVRACDDLADGAACEIAGASGRCTSGVCWPIGCGTGIVDDGELCDDGNMIDTDACIACKKAVCGDGYVEATVESCDGGIETAECNADCSLSMCGDLKFNPSAGETCDLGDKNGIYDSGCAADCKGMGAFCGDNKVDSPDEKCDPGVPPPASTCAANCQSISCTGAYANCDQMIANGCEINTDTNKSHCGECGKQCGFIQKCQDGECVL